LLDVELEQGKQGSPMAKITLDDIALGEVGPGEARAAISAALGTLTPEIAQKIYTNLRAWVWKAINGRRRDTELREWYDILKRAGSYLADDYQPLAERLHVLHELIYETISVSEVLPIREVLERRHVREVLAMLRDTPRHKLNREQIGMRLRVKQANLTRILNLMSSCGLIERATHGKQAIFELTSSGIEAVPPADTSTDKSATVRNTPTWPGLEVVALSAADQATFERFYRKHIEDRRFVKPNEDRAFSKAMEDRVCKWTFGRIPKDGLTLESKIVDFSQKRSFKKQDLSSDKPKPVFETPENLGVVIASKRKEGTHAR
jgi:DNA-binding MarR family transcriptional regulator